MSNLQAKDIQRFKWIVCINSLIHVWFNLQKMFGFFALRTVVPLSYSGWLPPCQENYWPQSSWMGNSWMFPHFQPMMQSPRYKLYCVISQYLYTQISFRLQCIQWLLRYFTQNLKCQPERSEQMCEVTRIHSLYFQKYQNIFSEYLKQFSLFVVESFIHVVVSVLQCFICVTSSFCALNPSLSQQQLWHQQESTTVAGR